MAGISTSPRAAGLVTIVVIALAMAATFVMPASPAAGAQVAPPTSGGVVSAAHGVRIDAGGRHTCAIRSDGALRCWGDNGVNQATPPSGTYVSVAAGYSHSCAVATNGTLSCWGTSGPDTEIAPAGTFTSVASGGGQHTCALRVNGTVACWGFRGTGWNGIDNTPPSGTFQKIDVGYFHSCGIRTNGTIACWGDDDFGLGSVPAGTYTDLALGDRHTCAVRTNGTIVCWGDNTFGERTAPAGTFIGIAAGGRHTCGVLATGAVDCWGNNSFGQSADPTGTFTAVALGAVHTCAVATNGTLSCWGNDNQQQLAAPTGAYNPIQVEAGASHTCALDRNSTIVCWGSNSNGQRTAPSGTFRALTAGKTHACAIRTDSTLVCWGDTAFGKSTAPAGTFSAVSAGGEHSCAVRTDGTMTCWGDNAQAQAPPAPAGTYTSVSTGNQHTCAVRTDAAMVCVGSNVHGQQAAPAGVFVRAAAGGRHSCGLRADGSVVCWGANESSQAPASVAGTHTAVAAGDNHNCRIESGGGLNCWGANTSGQISYPLGEYVDVTAGEAHSCAVRTNGTVVCWGANGDGQLGAAPVAGPATLPKGNVGYAYSHSLAGAANPPASFSLSAGTLPPGITLNSAGTLSGTPTADGTYTPTIAQRNVLGSVSQAYSLTIDPVFPDLRVTAVTNPPASITQTQSFNVTDTTRNDGLAAAPATATGYYLSTDTTFHSTDHALTGTRAVAGLAASAQNAGSTSVTVPTTVPAGAYFLIACADVNQQATESNETNNCLASTTTVTVAQARPDLRVTAVTNPPASITQTQSFNVTDTTRNDGLAAAPATATGYYLSTDTTFHSTDHALTGTRAVADLAAIAQNAGSTSVTVPTTVPAGAYFLIACADDAKAVVESNEANNCLASAATVTVVQALPDLRVTAVSNPPTARFQTQSFSVTDTTRNAGLAGATASTTRYHLSTDAVFSADDHALTGSRSVGPMQPGTQSADTVTVVIATTVPPGSYFLIACADGAQQVAESDEANNCRTSTAKITVKRALPDLRVTALANPPTQRTRGTKFKVTDTVNNAGLVRAGASTVRYYLSKDKLRNKGDRLLTGSRAVKALGVKRSNRGSTTLTVPARTALGRYYLLACADDLRKVRESSEKNNCRSSAARIRIR